MSDVLEVLGENKFFGARNTDINLRLLLETSNKLKLEEDQFLDISQQDLYINEKQSSNSYRIHGTINQMINNIYFEKTINTPPVKKQLDKTPLIFNSDNWSLVILKEKRFINQIDLNGKFIYSKGIKNLTFNSNQNTSLDFKLGIPAKLYNDKKSNGDSSLFMPLGHNFTAGDRVLINSLDSNIIKNGVYQVSEVSNDLIYINTTLNYSESDYYEINKILLNKSEYDSIINKNVLDPYNLIKPNFYLTKILDNEVLEYYVKALEVVEVIQDIKKCGFSRNIFNNQVLSFTSRNELNFTDKTNHLGEPVCDIYIGLIKKSNTFFGNISDVYSYFSKYVQITEPGKGIERITDNDNPESKIPKVGTVYFHSLCEYSTENLSEFELNKINHKFYYGNIGYSYSPFKKIGIRLKSPYIEDGDLADIIPNYAIYSRQREKYIWRDVFLTGFSDEDGNSIDFPFLNNTHYVYADFNSFLTIDPNNTIKYPQSENVIFSDEFDIFSNLSLGNLSDFYRNNENQTFNDPKC
jgi:hypothetical protein